MSVYWRPVVSIDGRGVSGGPEVGGPEVGGGGGRGGGRPRLCAAHAVRAVCTYIGGDAGGVGRIGTADTTVRRPVHDHMRVGRGSAILEVVLHHVARLRSAVRGRVRGNIEYVGA